MLNQRLSQRARRDIVRPADAAPLSNSRREGCRKPALARTSMSPETDLQRYLASLFEDSGAGVSRHYVRFHQGFYRLSHLSQDHPIT